MTPREEQDAQAKALDIWIEQERQLISYYESRGARADATAAAAVTVVFALAALTATNPEAGADVNKVYAWVAVVFLTLAFVAALGVRTVAGLKRSRTSWFSSGSDQFDCALGELRTSDRANPNPLDVRQRTLTLCVQRAEDAHKTARAKDQAAAFASVALAVALLMILVLKLSA